MKVICGHHHVMGYLLRRELESLVEGHLLPALLKLLSDAPAPPTSLASTLTAASSENEDDSSSHIGTAGGSGDVLSLAIQVMASLCTLHPSYFNKAMNMLIDLFGSDRHLLQTRGYLL
jgi:hypothetical protein